ncbi:MAG TPA: Ig-like domain-containing protein [Anaerolineaceae bacterium]
MKRLTIFGFFIIMILALAAPAAAQTPVPAYTVHSRRLFGYGGFSGEIRGTFRFSVSGPSENIQSVTYLMDGQSMAVVSQAPYSLDFQTESYPNGWHQITALVATRDGQQVTTPAIALNFLSAGQQGSAFGKIIIPLMIGIAGVLLLAMGIQALSMRLNPARRAAGAPRNYGLKGGTICARCGRPFPIHFWSLNLLGSYLDRCDYCGHVAVVRRRSPQELEDALRAEVAAVQSSETSLPGAGEESEEERMRKMLDDSRYSK